MTIVHYIDTSKNNEMNICQLDSCGNSDEKQINKQKQKTTTTTAEYSDEKCVNYR